MRTTRTVGQRLAVAVGIVALLSGCGDPFQLRDVPTDVPPAEVSRLSVCPRNSSVLESAGVAASSDNPRLTAGSVPAGFGAESLVRCQITSGQQLEGVDRYAIGEDRAAVTPELLAAVALPDQEFRGHGAGCAAASPAPGQLYLIDADGQAILLRLPRQPCGMRLEVSRALAGLSFSKVVSYYVDVPRS